MRPRPVPAGCGWCLGRLGRSPPSGSPVAGTPTPYRDKCPRTHFWKKPPWLGGRDGPEPAPQRSRSCCPVSANPRILASLSLPTRSPPPGAPVSENVPECFPAAPDSPCGGESLFSCFFLLSVLLIFLFSAPRRAPCGERLLGETSLQQGESKPVQGSPPGRVHICRTAN